MLFSYLKQRGDQVGDETRGQEKITEGCLVHFRVTLGMAVPSGARFICCHSSKEHLKNAKDFRQVFFSLATLLLWHVKNSASSVSTKKICATG